MSALSSAIRMLQLEHPDYFKMRPGRVPLIQYGIPRPSLLCDQDINGLRLTRATLPTGFLAAGLDRWEAWYLELVEDYLTAGPDLRGAVADDFAASLQLNSKQRAWMLPRPAIKGVNGFNTLLAFCLGGALFAGAHIEELTNQTLVVSYLGRSWGVRDRVELSKGILLPPMPYNTHLQGRYWRGGNSRNARLVWAYATASKARDAVAKEVLAALFWNVPESNRIDALLTPFPGNQGEE